MRQNGQAHALDHRAGDHPVGHVAGGGDLHGAEDGGVDGPPRITPNDRAESKKVAPGCTVRQQVNLFLGDLDAAEQAIIEPYRRASQDWRWDFMLGILAWALGQVARSRGRPMQAQRFCQEALATWEHASTTIFTAPCLGELAYAAALVGDNDAALTTLEEADRQRTPTARVANLWIDIARPWVTAAQGDLSSAIEQARTVLWRSHEAGIEQFALIAAHDVVRLGGATSVVDILDTIAAQVDGPYAQLCARHGTSAVEKDGDTLLDAAKGFRDLGMNLLAAEAAAHAATAYKARGRANRAQGAAAMAWSLAQRCEGARTPALSEISAPGLTAREREIARLASRGLTSRDIAARLSVSVRTVDNHLRSVYTKLGIDNRAQLADLL